MRTRWTTANADCRRQPLLHYDPAGKVSYLNGGMNAPKAALPGFSAADSSPARPAWGNFYLGSFEGIRIDPATGVMTACGDPRRCSMAEGL